MYTTTRSIAGGILTTCSECGHAISMNKICEKPLQSATDMLRHIAAHNASRRALAPVGRVIRPEPEVVPVIELALALGVPAPAERIEPPIAQRSPM
jgi:hypothetical protein